MYLYVGSIAVIICIYIWVLMDSCASLHHGDPRRPSVLDPECGHGHGHSMSRFGSLKRAHISRDKTSGTSFYLRVGALGAYTPRSGDFSGLPAEGLPALMCESAFSNLE